MTTYVTRKISSHAELRKLPKDTILIDSLGRLYRLTSGFLDPSRLVVWSVEGGWTTPEDFLYNSPQSTALVLQEEESDEYRRGKEDALDELAAHHREWSSKADNEAIRALHRSIANHVRAFRKTL